VGQGVDLAGSQRVIAALFGAQADQLGLGLRVAPDALEEIAQQGLGSAAGPVMPIFLPDSAGNLAVQVSGHRVLIDGPATMSTE